MWLPNFSLHLWIASREYRSLGMLLRIVLCLSTTRAEGLVKLWSGVLSWDPLCTFFSRNITQVKRATWDHHPHNYPCSYHSYYCPLAPCLTILNLFLVQTFEGQCWKKYVSCWPLHVDRAQHFDYFSYKFWHTNSSLQLTSPKFERTLYLSRVQPFVGLLLLC